jgi:hypothetical protein
MGQTKNDRYYDMYKRGVNMYGSHKAYMNTLSKGVRMRTEDAIRKTYCERHYGLTCCQMIVTTVIVAAVLVMLIVSL